jgi:hypothetical protein
MAHSQIGLRAWSSMSRARAPRSLLVALLLLACAEARDVTELRDGAAGDVATPGEGQARDEGGTPDEGSDPAPTAVVMAILVRGPDSEQTYLVASDEAPSGRVDLSNAPELASGEVWQSDEAIYFGTNERLQRFVVNADLGFELTGELSFANYGIDYLNNPPVFFSPTRAYYVDAPRGQVITFDPTAMELTGEIAVPELRRDGYTAWFGRHRRVGDRYLAAVLFTNEDWTQTAPDSTVGIVIQDDPGQPIRFLRDERGVGAYLSWADARGDFYFSADGLSGSLGIQGLQDVPGPRVLRVRAGSDVVDPDYLLDLAELLDTPGSFGFWPVDGTRFVVQAWASDVEPSDVLAPGDSAWAAPYFDWMLVDAVTREVQPVRGLERSVTNNTIELRLDGRTYLERAQRATAPGLHELYVLEADGSARKVAQADGDFWFLGRVRRATD